MFNVVDALEVPRCGSSDNRDILPTLVFSGCQYYPTQMNQQFDWGSNGSSHVHIVQVYVRSTQL
jgi:hypothetical protein